MWPLTVLTGVRVNGALGVNVWAFRREKKFKWPQRSDPGGHHKEPAYSCDGFFKDRSILNLILNLFRIQILTGTSVTNCNQKNGLMSTCRNDVNMFS